MLIELQRSSRWCVVYVTVPLFWLFLFAIYSNIIFNLWFGWVNELYWPINNGRVGTVGTVSPCPTKISFVFYFLYFLNLFLYVYFIYKVSSEKIIKNIFPILSVFFNFWKLNKDRHQKKKKNQKENKKAKVLTKEKKVYCYILWLILKSVKSLNSSFKKSLNSLYIILLIFIKMNI